MSFNGVLTELHHQCLSQVRHEEPTTTSTMHTYKRHAMRQKAQFFEMKPITS